MKLRMLAVGKLRQDFTKQGADEYCRRIRHLVPLEIVEVSSSSAGERAGPAEESARLAGKIRQGTRVVLFDERGKQLSTREMSDRIEGWMNSSVDVDLVIGGAWGVTEELRERSDEVWALSRLTMPHELARVVALEAIYRALTVIRNMPYHHG